MINEKILLGFPVDFKDICQIYPPKVNDVCGDKDFPFWQALFTITQEDLNDAYSKEDIDYLCDEVYEIDKGMMRKRSV